MTIRTLISFDHALTTLALSVASVSTYSSSTAFNSNYGHRGCFLAGAGSPPATVTTNGWFTLGISSASSCGGFVMSLADAGILQNGPGQAWIGFRTYVTGIVSNAANLFGVLPSSANGALGSSGANITPLITEAQANRLTAGVTGAIYVEVLLDTTANTYQTYVNGVPNVSGSLAAGFTHLVFGGQVYSGSYGQGFRDWYCLDVDATKPNGRLGAITSAAMSLTQSASAFPNYLNYNSFALNGGATISSTTAKFGNYSWLNGASSNSSVSVPDQTSLRGTGDYTVDFWVNLSTLSQSSCLFGKDANASPYARFAFINGVWTLYADSSGIAVQGNSTVAVNTWAHIAVVRYNGNWTIYQNGVSLATAAGSTFGSNTTPLYVGNAASNQPFLGNLDEFRVSNFARWTANFTPPAASAVPDANTMLLLKFEATFNGGVGDSSNNVQISPFSTAYGSALAMTPLLQNAPSNDAMTVAFTPNVANGQKIVGVQYKLAAQVNYGINMLASMVQGSNTKTLAPYVFPDIAAGYGRDLAGIQTLAPDGTAWTAANLAATKLVLQPQSQTAGALS